jgi:hypothetical protein
MAMMSPTDEQVGTMIRGKEGAQITVSEERKSGFSHQRIMAVPSASTRLTCT